MEGGKGFRDERCFCCLCLRLDFCIAPVMYEKKETLYKYKQNHNLKASFSCAYVFVAPV